MKKNKPIKKKLSDIPYRIILIILGEFYIYPNYGNFHVINLKEYYGKFKLDCTKTIFQIFKTFQKEFLVPLLNFQDLFYKGNLPKFIKVVDFVWERRLYSSNHIEIYKTCLLLSFLKPTIFIYGYRNNENISIKRIEEWKNNNSSYIKILNGIILKEDKNFFLNYLKEEDFLEPTKDICDKVFKWGNQNYSVCLYKKKKHLHLRKGCKINFF